MRYSVFCPRCGSPDTIPIVHGKPRPDLPRSIRRPYWPLRNWRVGVDDPTRVCRRCGHQWDSRFRV